MAKFALVANGIYASVDEAGLEFTAKGLTIKNGNIIIENKIGEQVFKVDDDGNLSFKGTINSQKGLLSGWILKEDELIDSNGIVGIHSGSNRHYGEDASPIRFWAGTYNPAEVTVLEDENLTYYNFAVTDAGTLYSNNANIRGAITTTSGRILNSFYVGPNNDTGIVIYGDDLGSYIGSMRYASGALGVGWTINSDGSAEFNNVSVRGKITSSVFEYDHISSVGGSLYVAPTLYTTKYSLPITKLADKSYQIKWELDTTLKTAFGNKILADGYYLLLDGNVLINNQIHHISNIFIIVTDVENAASDKTLTATFESELELEGKYFEPGAAIVLYGTDTTREGLYLTAMGADSPYLEIYSNDPAELQPVPAARLGNLSGIVDAHFASVSGKLEGYGLYSSNAYLRGQLMLPSAGVTNQKSAMVNSSPIRIWAGIEATDDITQSNFIVTEDGSLYAKQGTFEGIVKAVDSEFSGNIRAAGILLEEEDTSQDDALHDHFYVAYNILENGTFTPSYKNYVLNIDKDGLSIWEGGLQAYSDFANDNNWTSLMAYKSNEDGTAFPFLYLVDEGLETELTSRMVINKLHVINFTSTTINGGNYYPIISTQINNGLWFYGEQIPTGDACENIELEIFGRQNAGITLFDTQKILFKNDFPNGAIHIRTNGGVWINSSTTDEENYLGNALFVRGNTQWASNDKITLRLNGAVVEEVKKANGTTIGLNFVATTVS